MEWAKGQQHLHIFPSHGQTVVKILCTYHTTNHKDHIAQQCSVINMLQNHRCLCGDLIVCPFYVSSSVLAGSFCCNTPPESESNMNRLRGIKWCRWTHLNNLLWVMRSMQNLWNHNHQYRHYQSLSLKWFCKQLYGSPLMLRKESHLWQACWRLDSHHKHP